MAKSYSVGKKIVLKGRPRFWYILEVLGANRYVVSSGLGTGFIFVGAEVLYEGQKCVVTARVDMDIVEIRLPNTYTKNVNVKNLAPVRASNSSGGGQELTIHADDIDEEKTAKEGEQVTVVHKFNSYSQYVTIMDGMVEECKQRREGKGDKPHWTTNILNYHIEDQKKTIQQKGENWFGKPCPKTYEELMSRKKFQNMEMYHEFRDKHLKPMMEELKMKSLADLFKKKMLYNDLEIGMFDFSKASINLLSRFSYYSLKLKKVVPFDDVHLLELKPDVFEYKLKSDGSKVIIIPLFEEDANVDIHKIAKEIEETGSILQVINKYDLVPKIQNFSDIKKTYLYKEKVLRPNNAVRIFITVGGNHNISPEFLMFNSIACIAVTEILEMLGYAVNLNIVFGVQESGSDKINYQDRLVDGSRLNVFPIKKFEEQIDIDSLLYTTADPSYFRGKIFQYLIGMLSHFGDKFDVGIGSMPDYSFHLTVADAIFKSFLPNDKHKNILYFFFGVGFNNEKDPVRFAVNKVREIISLCEESNRQAREMLQS